MENLKKLAIKALEHEDFAVAYIKDIITKSRNKTITEHGDTIEVVGKIPEELEEDIWKAFYEYF